jgi:hypothetical protein
MRPIYMGEVRLLVLKLFLRDDNTGSIYTGGVSDDIIQNAIPIATNTILIIFLSPFGSAWGTPRDGPGTSHSYTTRE